MKKLKVAVGIHGYVVLLEKFPNDQEHAYLNEELRNIESDCIFDETPGIYLAEFEKTGWQNYEGEYDSYLDIKTLTKIE